MAGGSRRHNALASRVGAAIENARPLGCFVFQSDQRVRVLATGRATYPDISMVCGAIEGDPADPANTTVTNPALIVEVLSPTTEEDDRGAKWQHYQLLSSLQEYVLVSQSAPRIEVYRRLPAGSWEIPRQPRGTCSSRRRSRVGSVDAVPRPARLARRNTAASQLDCVIVAFREIPPSRFGSPHSALRDHLHRSRVHLRRRAAHAGGPGHRSRPLGVGDGDVHVVLLPVRDSHRRARRSHRPAPRADARRAVVVGVHGADRDDVELLPAPRDPLLLRRR